MNFETLRNANKTRQAEWPGSEQATLEFRTIEVAGEFGAVVGIFILTIGSISAFTDQTISEAF